MKLDFGIQDHILTPEFSSALIQASASFQFSIVQLLLEHKADVNYWADRYLYGNAIQGAAANATTFRDSTKVVELLLLHKAMVDPPDEKWDALLEKLQDLGEMEAASRLDALQRVCGNVSRVEGFTDANIGRYMTNLLAEWRKTEKSGDSYQKLENEEGEEDGSGNEEVDDDSDNDSSE